MVSILWVKCILSFLPIMAKLNFFLKSPEYCTIVHCTIVYCTIVSLYNRPTVQLSCHLCNKLEGDTTQLLRQMSRVIMVRMFSNLLSLVFYELQILGTARLGAGRLGATD